MSDPLSLSTLEMYNQPEDVSTLEMYNQPEEVSTLDVYNLPEEVFNRESGLLTEKEQNEVPTWLIWPPCHSEILYKMISWSILGAPKGGQILAGGVQVKKFPRDHLKKQKNHKCIKNTKKILK